MLCKKCDFNNQADAKFCERCGNPLMVKCKNCGKEFPADTAFCDNCGNNLSENNSNTQVSGYNSPERKQMSVLAVVSISIGTGALFSCILSFIYPIFIAIPAIITGGIGLKPNRNLRGLAIGGLALGVTTIAICLIALIGFRTISLMY